MSQENVEVVRRIYDVLCRAVNDGRLQRLLDAQAC